MNSPLALVLVCLLSGVAATCRAQPAPVLPTAPVTNPVSNPAAIAEAKQVVRAPARLVASDRPEPGETDEPGDERGVRSEPSVRHILLEDEGSKIDELRVRGQTQHIIVTPKVGTSKSYEILLAPLGRDVTEGTGGARSAVGKRVWSVLNF